MPTLRHADAAAARGTASSSSAGANNNHAAAMSAQQQHNNYDSDDDRDRGQQDEHLVGYTEKVLPNHRRSRRRAASAAAVPPPAAPAPAPAPLASSAAAARRPEPPLAIGSESVAAAAKPSGRSSRGKSVSSSGRASRGQSTRLDGEVHERGSSRSRSKSRPRTKNASSTASTGTGSTAGSRSTATTGRSTSRSRVTNKGRSTKCKAKSQEENLRLDDEPGRRKNPTRSAAAASRSNANANANPNDSDVSLLRKRLAQATQQSVSAIDRQRAAYLLEASAGNVDLAAGLYLDDWYATGGRPAAVRVMSTAGRSKKTKSPGSGRKRSSLTSKGPRSRGKSPARKDSPCPPTPPPVSSTYKPPSSVYSDSDLPFATNNRKRTPSPTPAFTIDDIGVFSNPFQLSPPAKKKRKLHRTSTGRTWFKPSAPRSIRLSRQSNKTKVPNANDPVVTVTAKCEGSIPSIPDCVRISITKSFANSDLVPSIYSFPPPRPAARHAPRMYSSQNTRFPLAAELAAFRNGTNVAKTAATKPQTIKNGRKTYEVAPLVLDPPTGPPPQRKQTRLHSEIVAGHFETAWNRMYTHPEEMYVMDSNSQTALDYAITFDTPPEMIEGMLELKRSIGTNKYKVFHPFINVKDNGEKKFSIKQASKPRNNPDTLPPYIYTDSGELACHRAFTSNCAVRISRRLMKYNPELSISETLTQGLVDSLKRVKKKNPGKIDDKALICWSTQAAKDFSARNDPQKWKVNAASGPLCKKEFVPNPNLVRTNLFDAAWHSALERAVVGRKVFADESLDTIEKCTDKEKLDEMQRMSINLMWQRLGLLLKANYDTFYGENARWKNGEEQEGPAAEIKKAMSEPLPRPPAKVPYFTFIPMPIYENLRTPITFPALCTALLNHNCALELVKFIVRLYPQELQKKTHDGHNPLQIVSKGLCPPYRWAWNVPKPQSSAVTTVNETKEERENRRERERSIPLIPHLLRAWPEAAKVPDDSGRLPVHDALELGFRFHRSIPEWSAIERGSTYVNDVAKGCYDAGLTELIDASPDVFTVPDQKTRLYPFMLAATSKGTDIADLNTVYELLLENPDSVQSGIIEKEDDE